MFERVKGALSNLVSLSRRHDISFVSRWLAGMLWLIEAKFMPLAREAYKQNEIVYACLRLLSQSVPEPPLVTYTGSAASATKTPAEITHPLVQLIRNPNELMTEYRFWELSTLHLAIVGTTHWWKERDNLGRIIALWPMRPDRVGPIYSDVDKPGQRVIWGWSYQQPGTGEFVPLPRRDVFSVIFPDIAGESGGIAEGFGSVQTLAHQVASDNEATKFVGALLANYAAPTTIIKTKTKVRTEAEANLIKAKYRHEWGGANRGVPALVDGDTEVSTVGFNLQQLEFPELRTTSESRIAAVIGVPAILVGLKVGLREGNNRASVTEQRAYFAETTLSNYWRRLQDEYTKQVAQEFGPELTCEFDILRVKAMSVHVQQALAPVKAGFEKGVVTRNGYRAALNLPLLAPEIGDVFVLPQAMIEVSADPATRKKQEEEKMEMARQIAEVGPQQAGALSPKGKNPDIQTSQQAVEKKQNTDIKDPKPDVPNASKGIKSLDFINDAEIALNSALRIVFDEFAPKAVNAIREGKAFDEQAFIAILVALLERELGASALRYAMLTSDEFAVGFDPAEVMLALNYNLSAYAQMRAGTLAATTRKIFEAAARKYAEDPDMTEEEILALLSPAFSDVRSATIAISENTRAENEAVAVIAGLMNMIGIKTVKIYHTAHDERVCGLCGPLDGRPEGQWGLFPAGPPIHTRCRCHVRIEVVK